MPVCDVCNGEEFEVHDGLYYCSQCNTQSQQVREEEAEEFGSQGVTKVQVRKVKKTGKKSRDFGSPWLTVQAFNIVLAKQVEVLISLGVSPSFKKTVQALWVSYLKECEVAFLDARKQNNEPRITSRPRQRDMQVLIHNKTELSPKRGRHLLPNRSKRKRRKRSRSRSKSKTTDTIETQSSKSTNGPLDDDDNISIMSRSLMSDSEWSSFFSDTSTEKEGSSSGKKRKRMISTRDRLSSFAKKIQVRSDLQVRMTWRNNRRSLRYFPDAMTLDKTLCFLFLGLLFHNSSIHLCDLVRWIREGHLPGVEASHLLPPTMKVQNWDNRFLRMIYLPKADDVICMVPKIAGMLGIRSRDLPGPPIMKIISRFAIDMNLPDELVSFIHSLLSLVPSSSEQANKNTFRCLENMWVAPEVRAMGVIIVALKLLFGLDGVLEKETCHLANRLLSSSSCSLDLFVWDEWKEHTKLKLHFLKQNHFPQSDFNTSSIIDVEKVAVFHQDVWFNWNVLPTATCRFKRNQPEFKMTMKKTFSKLLDMSPSFTRTPATLYPLAGYVNYYLSSDKVSDSLSSKLVHKLKRDFSKSTISYLLSADKSGLGRNQFANSNYAYPSTKYWLIPKTTLETVVKTVCPLPAAFNWLLEVCASLIEVSPNLLSKEVARLEDLFFDRRRGLKRSSKQDS